MQNISINGLGNFAGGEFDNVDIHGTGKCDGDIFCKEAHVFGTLITDGLIRTQKLSVFVTLKCDGAIEAVSANIPERYVQSAETRMDLYRRIALIRTEEEADDLTDELIDRFGDPPSSVNSLIHVALLRGEATRAGILDISQKAGFVKFVLADFDMARVSELYARPQFKGRVKVEAGSKPCLSLKLLSSKRVIEAAREFVEAWAATKPEADS